ncbi:MAG: glycosyltransferase family 39 protein [Actinomycetota bacterium]|nr:glycosyltransferase family 39 protein [Actinomycetota bacterium]
MKDAWQRLDAFFPTRRAAILLFVLATAGFWLASLGWPLAKGRDTWDYLAYYLQLFDSGPPLESLQVFRTPITPLVLGVPLDLGGAILLEVVLGILYAISIVAWSATALTFGRLPGLLTAVLLLVYPAYATLYHQASSDAIFATGLALLALCLARTLRRPSAWRFAVLGAGIALLVLVRPANQVLLPLALVPLLAPAAWRRRLTWSAACVAAALGVLGVWTVHNAVRYDEASVARGGRAWVPFLRVFLADRTISPENGDASRRLSDLIEGEVLAKEPYAALAVPLDAYLRHGSNYETVRLIALSDNVHGKEENYDVLFDSALEAIREHPGTYVRGVADAFREFLVQSPLREDVVPREQTAPEAPAPTFEADGVTFPNPQANVLLDGVPYGFVWCASDYIDSCTLEDPSLAWTDDERQQRYLEIVDQVRAWDAELPARSGLDIVTELLNRITPRFPRPPFWLALGAIGLVVRRPRDWRLIVVLWVAAGLVLLIHAASQGVTPEFALPLYPVFIVTALGALAGERARPAYE